MSPFFLSVYSAYQLEQMEKSFNNQKYPDVNERELLAELTGLPEDRIQVIISLICFVLTKFKIKKTKEKAFWKVKKQFDHFDIFRSRVPTVYSFGDRLDITRLAANLVYQVASQLKSPGSNWFLNFRI